MKRFWFGGLALVACVLFVVTAVSQPPPGKDRGPGKKDGPPRDDRGGPPPGGPPRYELGRVMPPHIKAELELTIEQEKTLIDLEKEVKDRLQKLLTPEQKKKLENLRPPRPGGPPPDGPGRLKDKEERPDRPKRPERPEKDEAPRGDIQWGRGSE